MTKIELNTNRVLSVEITKRSMIHNGSITLSLFLKTTNILIITNNMMNKPTSLKLKPRILKFINMSNGDRTNIINSKKYKMLLTVFIETNSKTHSK
ncbi:MAG: hypothetical protein N3D81_06485 [Spirochaetes bacterium]|nr:hypothetical protein [Spirochaetota bacterium]